MGWGKSGREKQIAYINAQMWNLEKWGTYLQSRNRDRDVEVILAKQKPIWGFQNQSKKFLKYMKDRKSGREQIGETEETKFSFCFSLYEGKH